MRPPGTTPYKFKSSILLTLSIVSIPRGALLNISFDMIQNQATNLSDSKDSSLDSCGSNDSKQDSIDSDDSNQDSL